MQVDCPQPWRVGHHRHGRKPGLMGAVWRYTVCGVVPLWVDSLQAIVVSRAGIEIRQDRSASEGC
ncbi:hypothetical protein B1218_37625 [Pseudomonas ogarae]|nr:hypothetical protein B1218_37625 [Pseudomonas ogarae]